MTDQPTVDELIRKTKQYEFTDGMVDFYLAVMWISLGAFLWFVLDMIGVWFRLAVQLQNTFGGLAKWSVLLALMVLPPLVMWGAYALMTYIRRRWLWSESGWVKPQRWLVPTWIQIVATAILVASVIVGIVLYRYGWVDGTFVIRIMLIAAGWSTGWIIFMVGQHIGIQRSTWVGIIGGLAPTLILLFPLTVGQTSLAIGLCWGMVLVVSGTLTLQRRLQSMKEAER